MKRLLIILLSLSILIQNMRTVVAYVSMKLQQSEVAVKHCTAKDITMCYGSCYIQKQIKEIEKESSQNPIKISNEKADFWSIIPFQTSTFEITNAVLVITKMQTLFSYQNLALQNFLSEIFQPPQLNTI